jgi:hypothetical protein
MQIKEFFRTKLHFHLLFSYCLYAKALSFTPEFLYWYWVTQKIEITQGELMKKKLFASALVLILATGAVFADHPNGFGIGVVGSYGWGRDLGAALSLKVPAIPVFWAINAEFDSRDNEDHFSIGISGDKYLIDSVLVKDIGLHWYVGLGAWGNFYSHTWTVLTKEYSSTSFGFGARLPIGLSWQPIPLLEVFLDFVPRLGVAFSPEVKDDAGKVLQKGGADFPVFGFPIELGIRLWL